jgi:hypothetical protein
VDYRSVASPWNRAVRCPRLSVLLATTALGLAGCGKNVTTEFPVSVGFQPIESVSDASWPAPLPGDPYPEALGDVVRGQTACHPDPFGPPRWNIPPIAVALQPQIQCDGPDWAHGRGYVHAPLATVYQALHDPAASRIHSPGDHWTPTLGVEPGYPISFRIRYHTTPLGVTVDWDLTYRGGPLEGTDAVPTVVGLRYQKTWGSDYIKVESGSLVAAAVDGAPDVTSVELVAWLDAATQGPNDVAGTVTDLFGDLVGVVHALP